MEIVYFNYKRRTYVIDHMLYLNLVEFEYWTLCRNLKWGVSKSDPASSLYMESTDNDHEENDTCGGHRGHGGCGGRNRHGGCGGHKNKHIECHNYGKRGYIVRNCWEISEGAEGQGPGQQNDDDVDIPEVDDQVMRYPPRQSETRTRNLPGGRTVKWFRNHK